MKAEDKWTFRTNDLYLSLEYGFWSPYVPPVPTKRFERFQRVKKIFKRHNARQPLNKKQIYERFIRKYKTVLNWLCISYNEKELFWQNLKRD
jgi:hypothetical protein